MMDFCMWLFTILMVIPFAENALVDITSPELETAQSSLWDAYWLASHGIDANNGLCTATQHQNNPWWSVNLGRLSTIYKVEILNRADCCPERLHDFNIWVMRDSMHPDEGSARELCAHYSGIFPSGTAGFQTVHCASPVRGSYLAVQIPQDNQLLTLCEVNIYGEEDTHHLNRNAAPGRPVQMSDDFTRSGESQPLSSYAVDNNHGTCMERMRAGSVNGKISIDMGFDVAVSQIRIHSISRCNYYCNTVISLKAWGMEDPTQERTIYIRINGTDHVNEWRGWSMMVLDECACSIKMNLRLIDHFDDGQQTGCMTRTDGYGFSPLINGLDDGDIVLAVSKDEVQRGRDNCYSSGLSTLGIDQSYDYRDAIAFIGQKGYPAYAVRTRAAIRTGPSYLNNYQLGASGVHTYTAGTVASMLATSLLETCGTRVGHIERGGAASLHCDAASPPIGRYVQINFPNIGVSVCEIEIYLSNMDEFCIEALQTCYYIPSHQARSADASQRLCRRDYASGSLAELNSDAWDEVHSRRLRHQFLNDESLMIARGPVVSGEVVYMDDRSTAATTTAGNINMYPLCSHPQTISKNHVVFRIPSGSGESLPDTMYNMWTGRSQVPPLNEPTPPEMSLLDSADDSIYKSPVIDCGWSNVQEVRLSMYKGDVEVAFVNFYRGSSSFTKENFFANLRGSAWDDLTSSAETVSLTGASTSSLRRRWVVSQNSEDTCTDSMASWFMVLDSDHTGCASWDSYSSEFLPIFLFSDNPEYTVETGPGLGFAELFVISVRIDEEALPNCVSTCTELANGSYQSCLGCNVYVTCYSNDIRYKVCRHGQYWQQNGVRSGACVDESSTCMGARVDDTCSPNGCSSSPCRNGATCSMAQYGWQCACRAGWTNYDCSVAINECASDPCVNGACTDNLNSYSCACDPGWNGINCDNNINECASNPCQNDAECVDGVNGYTCTCVPGYEGTLCETNIDECQSGPCQNGGVCTDLINSFICTCVTGYVGTFCETNFDECESNPCQNGARCDDQVNEFRCTCDPGYEGTLCEVDIDECEVDPCPNGATCEDGVNTYTCVCTPGYAGEFCDEEIDECASSPCQYNGSCTDEVNMYTCDCISGYSGVHCEDGPCQDSMSEYCLNGATCRNTIEESDNSTVGSVECECEDGFSGEDCSERESQGQDEIGGGGASAGVIAGSVVGSVAALGAGSAATIAGIRRWKNNRGNSSDADNHREEGEEPKDDPDNDRTPNSNAPNRSNFQPRPNRPTMTAGIGGAEGQINLGAVG